MKEQAFIMTPEDRRMVETTITNHCDVRRWKLYCANARTNHVHVVLTAPHYLPETVLEQFQAWCTRRLRVNHPDRNRFWTEGGSKRWLNSEASLEAAILYVRDGQ